MIAVEFSGRFDSGVGAGGSEVVAHDAATQRLFVTNGTAGMIDVLDFADPTDMSRLFSIDLNGLPNFGGVQSVAAHNGTVAVAMANANPALDGFVSFFDAATGNLLNTVTVGNLPDMLTFTPDGMKVLVANEGERVDALTDPAGSVSIIDISGGVAAATVTTADFTAFDGQEAALRAAGVRIFSGKSVSEDVEPEYIAVAPDGATAYVSLQEANALGVLDLATSTITAILPLGTKDHSLPGNELDPSDRDSGIEIANHPVKGFFMPDAISAYDANGQTFIVTANEGDSRDLSFFSEEARIADLTLDPAAFPNAAALQDDAMLGRLKTTTENGDTDNDGDFDELFSFGARSFSIFDSAGNLVFDSGADFENIISTLLPTLHNAQNFDPSEFDGRSDDKGPEPEGVTVGTVNGATYAFVGLERVGGVMVYDITDPANASFVDYVAPDGVDTAPEVLQFVDAANSPTGEAILLTSNEVSGTTAAFQVSDTYTLQILHASDLEGGVDAIGRAPNFAAIEAFLEGEIANSITLSAGDNYIPGPFFSAAGDQATFRDGDVFNDAYNTIFGTTEYDSLREGGGRVDITIMNAIGFDASAVGNHEFDAGSATFAELAAGDQRGADGPAGDRWVGAQFPYLSANLDFTGDGATSGIFTDEILPTAAFKDAPASEGVSPKIAPAAIHIENGEPIGIVGATTQLIASISSPGGVEETTGGVNDMQALADVLNPVIQKIIDSGVNKIILVSHLQQIALEKQLAGLLHGVDIIIAGGSDTLQADAQDTLRPGDVAAEGYPFLTQNADGKDVAIVSTDGEYSYVGRLVVDFDANGDLIASSIDENVSGAFATDDATVAALYGTDDPFAAGSSAAVVQDLVDAVEGVVIAKDSNVLGFTDVYLEGRRSEVRTEETNLGDLTADANLAAAQAFDPTTMVSIKNGGGIRAEIGEIDGITGDLLPPQENPVSGKPEGGISQLDVENALRFNNGLTLITLDQEELVEVLEHAVANSGPGATPGQFLQAAGVNFTYSTDLPSGARIIDAELSDGTQLVDNGVFVGDSAEDVRVVTLNFLAGGGDNYPFPALGEDRIDLVGTLTDPGTSDFATPGSEQDALAEFLQANHGDPASAFDVADTEAGSDPRFNAVAIAEETGTVGDDSLIGDQTVNILTGGDGDDTIAGKEGFDILTGGAGNDMVIGDDADSIVFADTLGNASITQLSASHVTLFNAFLGAGEQFDAAAPVFRVVSADGSDVVQGGQFVFDDATVSVGSSGALQLEAAGSLEGGAGNETFVGSAEDDSLSGNGGDDVLIGGKGDDAVSGGAGSDMLVADAGNDTLSSGSGDDIIGVVTTDGELSLLFGGSGDDVFAFAAAGATTGLDTAAVIVDFTAGEDTINFAALRTGGGAALTFADIAAVMADDANGDAAIDLSGLTDEHGNAVAGTLTLAGVSSVAVTASDFEFNSAIDFSGVSGLFDPGA